MSRETDKQNELYDLTMEMRREGCRMTRRDVLRLGAFAGLSATPLAALLSACGGGPVGKATPGARAGGDDKLQATAITGDKDAKLTYWGAWGGTALGPEKAAIEKWNKDNPDMKVQALQINDIDQKFLVSVAGRRPPDIIKLDRFMLPGYALNGAIQDVSGRIQTDGIDVKQWFQACMDETKINDKYYGLPWNTDNRGLWYNNDILSKEGIKDPPKTTEDAAAMGEQLNQRKGKKLSRMGFPAYGGNWQIGWHWAWGGEWLKDDNHAANWNNDMGADWLSWLQKNVQALGGQQLVDTFSKTFQGEAQGPYWRGQIAMVVDGSWVGADWKKFAPDVDMGASPPPRPQTTLDKGPLTWSGGFAFCIPSGIDDEKADAAWKFIKYYCMDDGPIMSMATQAGNMPAIEKFARDDRYLSANKFNKNFVDLMKVSRFRDITPVGNELWFDIIWPMPNDVFFAKKTVKQALEESERKANKVLDRGWKQVEKS